jgi:hypothetical protein
VGLVWKLKSPSGLKGLERKLVYFYLNSLQSRRGFEVSKVALGGIKNLL